MIHRLDPARDGGPGGMPGAIRCSHWKSHGSQEVRSGTLPCRLSGRGVSSPPFAHLNEEDRMRQTRREFLKTTALATGATSIAGFPLVARAQASKVVVWWNKGYYPEEDAAMQKIVKEFENRATVEVDLSFTAQEDLRKKVAAKYGKLYGIGMTESTRASDTLYNFDMALLSYHGEVIDAEGKVVADQAKNKKAITETLKWFGELFTSGYVPPDATNWTDGDNNAGFHSRLIVMTPNPSQSIPAAQFFHKEDPDKKNYFDNMATIEWPDGPDGKKARYLSAVKTLSIPHDAKNAKGAKDFIKFVVEKERFSEYIKAANGRWFPAFKDVADDPFWRQGHKGPKGQKDLHVPVATTIFLDRENKVFDHWKHPAFSQVYDENVWGKAMARIAIDKWTADKAADEGIERVKAIFTHFK